MSETHIPSAELLIAPGCTHCPGVLSALSELLKENLIGELLVINVAVHPEAGAQRNTRSVPWARIGLFEIEGATSKQDLRKWAEHAQQGTGLNDYFQALLESQHLDKAILLAQQNSEALDALFDLVSDLETPMGVRIGIAAIFEDLDSNLLLPLVPRLIELSNSEQVSLRADAAHYLGLSRAAEAKVRLQVMRNDSHPDVQAIARDALDEMD